MVDIVIGLFGGAAASLAAALVFAFDDSIPFPVSLVIARLRGTESAAYYTLGLAGTFAYGIPAGAVYVSVFSHVSVVSVTSFPGGLLAATVWGLLLAGLFVVLIGDRRASTYDRYLVASHLLYALVLAGFVALGPTDPTTTVGPAGSY